MKIDLSHVAQARDIHVAFSTALGFPEWYGHNWDAFWDLVSSDYPLPDRLTIRGLDHVERVLPAEATKMLACFADYNNSSGRVCELAVTDDYTSPMFLLRYEATPVAPIEGVGGAFVNCWIKAASSREANEIAVRLIEDEGWQVTSHEAMEPTGLASATEDNRLFVAQACVDGAALDFHTWSSEADSDEDDSDEMLVQAAVNWSRQKADFTRDGSLRDIYVEHATIDDWKLVVAVIQRGDYGARLQRGGITVAMPANFESLFDTEDRYFLTFRVSGVGLDCHFFAPGEIEFSFGPDEVTEDTLQGLLAFMVDLGDATKKPVIMTPENCTESPIFRYEPSQHQLSWLAPLERSR